MRRLAALALALAAIPSVARADDDRPIVVWPTLTPAGDDAGPVALHKPSAAEAMLYVRAQELDATMRDALQDLGYTLDVADAGPTVGHARDLDLIERASRASAHGTPGDPHETGTWVLSARLEEVSRDAYILRIVAVPPRGRQLRVRIEKVAGTDVAVRGLVLLRDLLASTSAGPPEPPTRQDESPSSGIMTPLRSQGRAILAANAALFGAFSAYSIQRASGSEDPRLLYPLLTLGTGIGLGAALLVAEEWDVGTGDAWTLAGGAWWGAASGILIANGRNVQPLTDRYAWGVGGGLVGLSLATLRLTRSKADEGDAILLHSGAGLGLGLGALADFFYRGNLDNTPYSGAGYGGALGLVTAGTAATFLRVSASRVLLVDLGAGLGAATGAALASPLVFENLTQTKTRGFITATAAGTLLGGATALWLTRDRGDKPDPKQKAGEPHVVPYGGIIGASQTKEGDVSAYGIGAHGTW